MNVQFIAVISTIVGGVGGRIAGCHVEQRVVPNDNMSDVTLMGQHRHHTCQLILCARMLHSGKLVVTLVFIIGYFCGMLHFAGVDYMVGWFTCVMIFSQVFGVVVYGVNFLDVVNVGSSSQIVHL